MSSSNLPESHRALVCTSEKKVEVRTKPLPEIKNEDDDVLVRVRAVTLNPTDWKHVAGLLKDGDSTGSDFAGEVVKAAGKWSAGDRVAGFTRGGHLDNTNGAFQEYIRSPAALLWKIPSGTSFEDAASMGGIGLSTAVYVVNYKLGLPRWNAIEQGAEPTPFLIWSGATSVGDFLVQLCKILNLKAYVTASPKHHERLKSLGAAAVFDYKDADVASKIKEASGGKIKYGVDTISELGTTEIATRCFSDEGGKLATLLPVKKNEGDNFHESVEVIHCLIYATLKSSNEGDHEIIASWNKVLPDFIEQGKIQSNPLKKMQGGLEGIPEGLEYLKSGKASGEKLSYTLQDL